MKALIASSVTAKGEMVVALRPKTHQQLYLPSIEQEHRAEKAKTSNCAVAEGTLL
jgi:hypothetical protein